MAFVIDFDVNSGAAFRVVVRDRPVGNRIVPLHPSSIETVERIVDRGDLDLCDFAYVDGAGNVGVFVASKRALDGLLRNQPGLVVLGEVESEPTHVLVQIVLQIDLVDIERSMPSPVGFGLLEGVHLIDEADEVAGCSVFLVPGPMSGDLFCSVSWRQAFLDFELTGLLFQTARVD